MRTGESYVAGLRDGRSVYLDGERVEDVTRHPAFAAAVQQIATMYDRAADVANLDHTSVVDAETGERVSTMWLIPRSAQDLAARRRGHRFWAEGSYGLMGRTPDCVAGVLTAFAAVPDVLARGGQRFADHACRFHARARREDLYLAYAVNPPHVDRSKPAHQQPEPFLYAGVVRERDDGIVVRGALMVATSAVLADVVLATYLVPLQKGDEDYAISVVMPMGSEGLRLYPRRPYATGTAVADYPLSARFDETDSLLVLDDVFVPWEHVFVYRNVELVHDQWYDTPAHALTNFQALVRYCVKLEFAAGLAITLAELHNTVASPSVQAQLGGEVATVCAAIEALVHAAESQAVMKDGIAWPNPRFLYAAQSYQQQSVVDLMRTLRQLAGGAFVSVPSSMKVFESPATGADARRYYRSVGAEAEERIRFLNLMWDFVGTEFGGRQLQYEMFYSAGQPVVDARAFRYFDWERGRRLVSRCLEESR
jgi:4-hydroxyphenylacetate 3-monooxygenase